VQGATTTQITGGLSAGDVVVLPTVSVTTTGGTTRTGGLGGALTGGLGGAGLGGGGGFGRAGAGAGAGAG
jgi:hypothetical protein